MHILSFKKNAIRIVLIVYLSIVVNLQEPFYKRFMMIQIQ